MSGILRLASDLGDEASDLKIPSELVAALRCPGKPGIQLRREKNCFLANDGGKPVIFPIINGTPILINEENSVFRISDFTEGDVVTTMDLRDQAERFDTPVKKFKKAFQKLIPTKSRNVSDFSAADAVNHIFSEIPDARVLVIGAGDSRFQIEGKACIVYTDVALAEDTHLIADAHDIPFTDNTFDAVFAVAVLEHVADPYRCVAEIQRVLKPSRGRVYAVTPFLQQVHLGRYDFTRFTAIGHRRLFRWFDEDRSGVACGPGMVMAWSIEYLLSSMAEGRVMHSQLRTISRFIGWPFLLLDGWLARKRGAYDSASAYYFYGRLRDKPVPDRDIVKTYRGLN